MNFFACRFEEQEVPGSKSFFTEIIASISDIKFAKDGRYILSRDYMTLKVWIISFAAIIECMTGCWHWWFTKWFFLGFTVESSKCIILRFQSASSSLAYQSLFCWSLQSIDAVRKTQNIRFFKKFMRNAFQVLEGYLTDGCLCKMPHFFPT